MHSPRGITERLSGFEFQVSGFGSEGQGPGSRVQGLEYIWVSGSDLHHQDVLWLDVTMYYAHVVEIPHTREDVDEKVPNRLFGQNRPGCCGPKQTIICLDFGGEQAWTDIVGGLGFGIEDSKYQALRFLVEGLGFGV